MELEIGSHLTVSPMVWQKPEGALRRVAACGGKVSRIVAGFSSSDVFWLSGCAPNCFALNSFGSIVTPSMLWELTTGELIAVDDIQVGYGGKGPSQSFSLLIKLGLDEPTARTIAYSRTSVTELDNDGKTVRSIDAHDSWPHFLLHTPRWMGSAWVLRVTAENMREQARSDSSTSDSTPARLASVLAAELDRTDLPAWAMGPRIAQVYFNRESAQSAGYCENLNPPYSTSDSRAYQVIVRQGDLQLWFELPEPVAAHLPPLGTYDLLMNFGGLDPLFAEVRGSQILFQDWWTRNLTAAASSDPPKSSLGTR